MWTTIDYSSISTINNININNVSISYTINSFMALGLHTLFVKIHVKSLAKLVDSGHSTPEK